MRKQAQALELLFSSMISDSYLTLCSNLPENGEDNNNMDITIIYIIYSIYTVCVCVYVYTYVHIHMA